MKILVTGGTGFLGKRLALRLHQLGYTVTTFGRNQAVNQTLKAQGIQTIEGDLRNKTQVLQACQYQDVVFHAGALSAPWGKPSQFYETNVQGTHYLIQGCQQAGLKRLIYVSSPSIYFDFKHRLHIRETDPPALKQANAYSKSKLLAEQAVMQAHQQGLASIIVRPRAIFGPGDQTILPRLIRANQQGGVPLIDNGEAILDITYVDNVVEALLCCLQAPDAATGKAYNITNGEPMQIKFLLEKLFQYCELPFNAKPMSYQKAYWIAGMLEWVSNIILFGKEPLLTRYTVGVLAKSQVLDITMARELLGYCPVISLEEGLQRYAQWWKEQYAIG